MMGMAASGPGSRWRIRPDIGSSIEEAVKPVSLPGRSALPSASDDGAGDAPAPGIVITRGRYIHLRTFTPADLAHLSRWAEDEHLSRMVGSELLQVYKDVYERDPSFYDAVLVDTTQIVFIIMANDGSAQPVGLVRLFNIHQSEGYAGIETIVGDRRPEWRGFGVQASRLMAYYGVDVLGLRRIEAKAYEYNPLSINTLKRNGFTHEGTLRKASWRDGRYWDILVFGLLRDELEEQRRQDRYLVPRDGQGDLSEPS
jgi:RimJ/RimL family protein N-acetyltransferase